MKNEIKNDLLKDYVKMNMCNKKYQSSVSASVSHCSS